MTTDNPQTISVDSETPKPEDKHNQEWKLSDLIRLVMTELDQAQDTLVLKSQNRRLSMMVNQLSFDLQVDARVDKNNNLQFQTVPPGKTGMTVLKLGFIPALDTQLQDIHKTRNLTDEHDPLDTLPRILPEDIQQLNMLGIDSVSELRVATQTPAMLSQISQKTPIPEWKLRLWQGLPFVSSVAPEKGAPGSIVTIDGGNFGETQEVVKISFQGKDVEIKDMTSARLTVEIPKNIEGSGMLMVSVNEQHANPCNWAVTTADLCVSDITWKLFPSQNSEPSPSDSTSLQLGDEVVFKADLKNQGTLDAPDFKVQWLLTEFDDQTQKEQTVIELTRVHGLLKANEESKDRTIDFKYKFDKAGTYRIKLIADVNEELPDTLRTNNQFVKELKLGAVMRPGNRAGSDAQSPMAFNANELKKLTLRDVGEDIQELKLGDQVLLWTYRDEGSGYLYFEDLEARSGWEFALCLDTDLKKLDKTLLRKTSFYGAANQTEGPNVFGSRWEDQVALMVTDGQIILARQCGKPETIYAISLDQQTADRLVVNYGIDDCPPSSENVSSKALESSQAPEAASPVSSSPEPSSTSSSDTQLSKALELPLPQSPEAQPNIPPRQAESVSSPPTSSPPPDPSNTLLAGSQLAPGQALPSNNRQFQLLYQPDGNLVLYRERDKQALWSANTGGRPAGRCVLQTDGNLVVYEASGTPIWATNICGSQYVNSKLILQDDGNLVICDRNNTPFWSTNTWGQY